MFNILVFLLSYFLILLSTIGFGYSVLNYAGHKILGNNLGYAGLTGILFLVIISYISHNKVLDSQCGYRRYLLLDLCSESYSEKGFQFESEVLIKLLRKNCSIEHIEISTIYTKGNSSINNVKDTYKFIGLILRTLLKLNIKTRKKNLYCLMIFSI